MQNHVPPDLSGAFRSASSLGVDLVNRGWLVDRDPDLPVGGGEAADRAIETKRSDDLIAPRIDAFKEAVRTAGHPDRLALDDHGRRRHADRRARLDPTRRRVDLPKACIGGGDPDGSITHDDGARLAGKRDGSHDLVGGTVDLPNI